MSRSEKEPLFDDNPWGDGKPGNFESAGNRMSAGMKAGIIIAALVAVIAVAVAVTVVALTGNDGDPAADASSETAGPAPGSTSSPETETEPEEPAMDSAAMLEGAGFDVVISGFAPEAVESWGDYQLERSTDGRVRVFEHSGPIQATLDGGQWPMSMNSCGSVMYLVVFRGVNEEVSIEAGLVNSVGTVVDSAEASQGWMLLTNCATPQWEYLSTTGIGNLADIVYDVHEYRQSASAAGAGAAPAVAPTTEVAAEPTVVRCLEGTPGPALWSDGTKRFAQQCIETPEAQRSLMGERCCGGLYGRQECGEELWQELCNSGPPQ